MPPSLFDEAKNAWPFLVAPIFHYAMSAGLLVERGNNFLKEDKHGGFFATVSVTNNTTALICWVNTAAIRNSSVARQCAGRQRFPPTPSFVQRRISCAAMKQFAGLLLYLDDVDEMRYFV